LQPVNNLQGHSRSLPLLPFVRGHSMITMHARPKQSYRQTDRRANIMANATIASRAN